MDDKAAKGRPHAKRVRGPPNQLSRGRARSASWRSVASVPDGDRYRHVTVQNVPAATARSGLKLQVLGLFCVSTVGIPVADLKFTVAKLRAELACRPGFWNVGCLGQHS